MNKNITVFVIFIFFHLLNYYTLQYEIPDMPESVIAEDIDLDGDNDIVVGHLYSNDWTGITTLENENGEMINTSSFYLNGQHRDLCVNLIDDNNDFDLVTQHYENRQSQIAILKNFNNSQDNLDIYNINNYAEHIECCDVNDDDDLEVVFISNNGENWGILYNNGEGQFSEPEYYELESFPSDIACGKLNDDNSDDIVICSSSWIKVFFSYETGFESFDLIDASDQKVIISDIDNDDDNDIISFTASIGNLTFFRICENIGNNTFINHGWQQFNPMTFSFTISDLNNDNLPEIICTNENGAYILYNLGNFEFSQPLYINTPYIEFFTYPVICTDLDGNNYDDIIIAIGNASEGIIYIVFNDGEGNFNEDPVGVNNDELLTKSFHIQNYPNPFNQSTSFNYDLPVNIENATVEIFNIRGQKIKQFSDVRDQTTDTWHAEDQASGVYFYKLDVNGKTNAIRKCLLVK